jgi:copper chaperone NosL
LIGFKQLLNFGAYSVPDLGGWIFVGVGAILLFLVVMEGKRSRKFLRSNTSSKVLFPVSLIVALSSCTPEPQALNVGKDNCFFCKMTISDNRFGAEVVTKKSKVYKFDDSHCLLSFLQSKVIGEKEIAEVYLTDFSGSHTLVRASEALLLKSESFQSPMNGNLAAFSVEDSMKKIAASYNATVVRWDQLNK